MSHRILEWFSIKLLLLLSKLAKFLLPESLGISSPNDEIFKNFEGAVAPLAPKPVRLCVAVQQQKANATSQTSSCVDRKSLNINLQVQ